MKESLQKKLYKQIAKDDEPLRVKTVKFKQSEYSAFLAESAKDGEAGAAVLRAFIRVYRSGDIEMKL